MRSAYAGGASSCLDRCAQPNLGQGTMHGLLALVVIHERSSGPNTFAVSLPLGFSSMKLWAQSPK